MPKTISGHYSQAYDAELNEAISKLAQMVQLVDSQLEDAIHSFISGDRSLAQKVVSTDDLVNTFEVSLEQHCLEIIVRRQPTATDLRLVLGIMKSVGDVERIGDYAESIAKQVLQDDGPRPKEAQLEDIRQMAFKVRELLNQATSAFAEMDAAKALDTLRLDRFVDDDYGRILRHNLTYMLEDTRQITRGLNLIWAARALERIGDHAKNICEFSIFVARGKIVTHLSDAELQTLVEAKQD